MALDPYSAHHKRGERDVRYTLRNRKHTVKKKSEKEGRGPRPLSCLLDVNHEQPVVEITRRSSRSPQLGPVADRQNAPPRFP